MENLLFSDKDKITAFDECLESKKKINGVKCGLPSMCFYLENPTSWNIWAPTLNKGMNNLVSFYNDKHDEKKKKNRYVPKGEKYKEFNESVIWFRDRYHFEPVEMDWIFTIMAKYLKRDNKGWYIKREVLDQNHVSTRK